MPCDKMDKFEEGFPTGVYVATGGKDKPKLKMKALSDHCKQIRKDRMNYLLKNSNRSLVTQNINYGEA